MGPLSMGQMPGKPALREVIRRCVKKPRQNKAVRYFDRRKKRDSGVIQSPSQSVKEPLYSEGEGKSFGIKREEESKKTRGQSRPLAPEGQLFQVHGSILKPDPSCHCGQNSMVRISHGVLFLCVGKDTLNGFFSLCVEPFSKLCFFGLPP